MIIYDHKEDITLWDLNILGNENWEVVSISGDPTKIKVWLKKQNPPIPYTLVENTETGAEFYLDKSFSYGDAIIITFFTIFLLAFLGKIIFNYFFHNE